MGRNEAFMATKKTTALPADVIAEARKRAEQTRRQLKHVSGVAEFLTPQELADAAPFYLVLRNYVRQLKGAREAAGVTLAELSARCGLAVETLSRLETGALTNPTWKTLGVYAAALGLRPRLVVEATPSDGGGEAEVAGVAKGTGQQE
jgi:DNA-binding XRE family transcriptional regulator